MKLDGRYIISCKEKILNPSLQKQFMNIPYFLCLPSFAGRLPAGRLGYKRLNVFIKYHVRYFD